MDEGPQCEVDSFPRAVQVVSAYYLVDEFFVDLDFYLPLRHFPTIPSHLDREPGKGDGLGSPEPGVGSAPGWVGLPGSSSPRCAGCIVAARGRVLLW